jgi:hypothetical protein
VNYIGDLQLGKNRLFATGAVRGDNSSSSTDMIVRAYDIQSDGKTMPPAGGCRYTLEPSSQTVRAGGGTFTFSVSVVETPPFHCAWRAESQASGTFIHVFGGDASGVFEVGTTSGTITYDVAANRGAERSGLITLKGVGVTGIVDQLLVTQEAAPVP